jgi:15-cis-phytoene synthase
MSASLLPFVDIVRAHNRDRYSATLFAPESKRTDLFILYAFDAEVSRIRAVISDPLPGEIRLQWWREIINGEREGEATGNLLASGIRDVISKHSLPINAFEAYFDAKIFEFYNDAFPDTLALEAWCGETGSAILQMAAVILDGDAAKSSADISGHGGVALSISNILQGLTITRSRGQCYISQDILAACGLTRESFVTLHDNPALKRATDALAELGISHLKSWKDAAKSMPSSLKPAYLPLHNAKTVLLRSIRPSIFPAIEPLQVSSLRSLTGIILGALR